MAWKRRRRAQAAIAGSMISSRGWAHARAQGTRPGVIHTLHNKLRLGRGSPSDSAFRLWGEAVARIISIVELLEHSGHHRGRQSASSRSIDEAPRKRRIGRACAKASACMAMIGVVLLLLFLIVLHSLRNLSVPSTTVQYATPLDIAALFGSRGR